MMMMLFTQHTDLAQSTSTPSRLCLTHTNLSHSRHSVKINSSFMIEWENHFATDEVYEPMWQPKRDFNGQALLEWRRRKRRKNQVSYQSVMRVNSRPYGSVILHTINARSKICCENRHAIRLS